MTAILRESYLLKTDHLTNKARTPISRIFIKDYSFYLNKWQQGIIFYEFSFMESSQKEVRSSVLTVFRVESGWFLIKYGIFETF
jgi:hypothetical protein